MSKNYIKIELINSSSKTIPTITMEYDDIEYFQSLIFFLMSDSGTELFVKTIEQNLIQSHKIRELEILRTFEEISNSSKNKSLLLQPNDVYLIKPSSFK